MGCARSDLCLKIPPENSLEAIGLVASFDEMLSTAISIGDRSSTVIKVGLIVTVMHSAASRCNRWHRSAAMYHQWSIFSTIFFLIELCSKVLTDSSNATNLTSDCFVAAHHTGAPWSNMDLTTVRLTPCGMQHPFTTVKGTTSLLNSFICNLLSHLLSAQVVGAIFDS